MKRMLCFFMVLACIGFVGARLVTAGPVERGFGFGGAMAIAFFPDMTGINTFMSENGLAPMGDFLVGAGGSGRGGVVGGPSFGGIVWGVLATSEGEDRHAELIFGGGGVDIGAAIGGDERSILTLGTVFGGAASLLAITGYLVETAGCTPSGLVIEPTRRELGRAVGFVQPYVSMSAQLLPWMGFELRIGYVLPVFGIDFGDLLGIPAPSLELSGPTVSLGLAFGGIGSGARAGGNAQVASVSDGSFVVHAGDELVIENAFGNIVISELAVDATQTPSDPVVEWEAVRTAREKRIDRLQVVSDVTDAGTTLKTVGTGRVDYIVRVPAGIDLRVRGGAGDITLVGHEAMTIIIENGAGDVDLQGVRATALIIEGDAGRIDLLDVDAQQLVVVLGIGDIVLALPVSASATVAAEAGLGEVSIDPFPGMTGGVRNFLGKSSGDVTLGAGERAVALVVGLGKIVIEMRIP